MTKFGYTLMTEQSGSKDPVQYAISAEDRGFDFEVCSDHFSPWLTSQGHAPNAWAVLGAVANDTEQAQLYTYVTCPTMRYHPAIVAQQAATVQILAEGRFTLGLGSGENLNEHVVGGGWPTIERRQNRLREAIKIIRELFGGRLVNWRGDYFQVDSARLWDVPDVPVPIGVAMSGTNGVEKFAKLADHLIAVQPDADLVGAWHAARQAANGTEGGRVVGQIPVSWDPDRDAAIKRATTSSGGLPAAGRSMPTYRRRPASPARPNSCAPKTSPRAFPAGPTWMRSWTPSDRIGRPGSPMWRWCRSAARRRTDF
jgi:G6PDH family F420-dependent oxidoreductase